MSLLSSKPQWLPLVLCVQPLMSYMAWLSITSLLCLHISPNFSLVSLDTVSAALPFATLYISHACFPSGPLHLLLSLSEILPPVNIHVAHFLSSVKCFLRHSHCSESFPGHPWILKCNLLLLSLCTLLSCFFVFLLLIILQCMTLLCGLL